MKLKELSYWALYTIVVGLAISMIYITGMNIGEEKQSSRITTFLFLTALMVYYFVKKEIEFLKIMRYTGIFFVSIFAIYLLTELIMVFIGYDLISYHGVALLSTLIVIGCLIKFFRDTVKESLI